MKLGLEVEGRFKGVQTLFVSEEEFTNQRFEIDCIIKDMVDIKHIYISDRNNRLDLEQPLELRRNLLVSIERTSIPNISIDPTITCVLLRVDTESFWALRPTDQVKFSKNHNVRTVTVENMSMTIPTDFDNDVELFQKSNL
jgi:hypothetical protein